MRVLREGRIGITANRDDLHLKTRDGRQNTKQFFGLAARAQRQNGVAVCHHSEVTVQSVEGIEHDGGRTSAGEGRGNFAADVSRFSHSEDNDLSAGIDRCF